MCGRFSNALALEEFRQAVQDQLPKGCHADLAPDAEQYNRSFNVAPQTRSLVLRRAEDGGAGDKHGLVLQSMKWGLVPRSTKTLPKGPDAYKTINARDDTILSGSGLWAPLFKRAEHRCVVMVQGFYEWQKKGSTESSKPVDRVAHFVGMNEPGKGRKNSSEGREYRLMPLAGLWERVRFEGESEDLYTFTIITTESNKQLGFLHDRMPVILPDAESIALWLGLPQQPVSKHEEEARMEEEEEVKNAQGPSSSSVPLARVAKLLKPFDNGELQCYRVPPEVGKVGNNDPKFILPVSDRKDGIMAAFGRAKAKNEAFPSASSQKPAAVSSRAKKEEEEEEEEEKEGEEKKTSTSHDINSETHAPMPADTPKRKTAGGQDEGSAGQPAKRVKTEGAQDDSVKSSPGSSKAKKGKHPPSSSPQSSSSKGNKSAKSSGNRDIRSFFA
ncbi:unnamed protein product [Tilletia controversa]|uniref:DUF159-domain-containing protein n=2 Tax=Tilletia TaxID=13289 RepID=A0A177VGJ7_9BASI|nr:hypothetical protein CF336_g644 [Tilletia laevis]KAE8265128.1 hypothetical protein A4X03_0g464 [Tilletia caries]CAD6907744.1 unnamed protein product [Tilletia controversa]KAE8208317.1 hypothetical protein CF335_g503 [Tilletia laevis]CAD6886104.1 unnamed protein product [Tilletia caries]